MKRIREFFKKVGNCIKNAWGWVKEHWKVVFIPIAFFVVSIMTHNNRKELQGEVKQVKDDIKEIEKEVKALEKEEMESERKLSKEEKVFEHSSEELNNAIKEAEETSIRNEAVVSELGNNIKDREKRGETFIR